MDSGFMMCFESMGLLWPNIADMNAKSTGPSVGLDKKKDEEVEEIDGTVSITSQLPL